MRANQITRITRDFVTDVIEIQKQRRLTSVYTVVASLNKSSNNTLCSVVNCVEIRSKMRLFREKMLKRKDIDEKILCKFSLALFLTSFCVLHCPSRYTQFTPAKHVLLNWCLQNENHKQRTEKLYFSIGFKYLLTYISNALQFK